MYLLLKMGGFPASYVSLPEANLSNSGLLTVTERLPYDFPWGPTGFLSDNLARRWGLRDCNFFDLVQSKPPFFRSSESCWKLYIRYLWSNWIHEELSSTSFRCYSDSSIGGYTGSGNQALIRDRQMWMPQKAFLFKKCTLEKLNGSHSWNVLEIYEIYWQFYVFFFL